MQMQVHLCTFYRQEELANRRTRPAPRRGLPEAQAASAGCLAGGSYSSHLSWSSVRGIPGSAAVLCRSSNAARATTDAKRAALLKRICSQQIAARCIGPGQLMPCRRFRNALLCSTAARQSATTTRAAAALRRSHWSAPGCRKMRGGDARTHNDRESTMPLASNAADRTLLGQRWRGSSLSGTEQKFAVRRGGVEPALYTVEGRQTGDLRQKCGSALIRKAKLPARSCGRPCLLAGTADRPHLSASAPQGGGSCVASWSSMTTGTLAWR